MIIRPTKYDHPTYANDHMTYKMSKSNLLIDHPTHKWWPSDLQMMTIRRKYKSTKFLWWRSRRRGINFATVEQYFISLTPLPPTSLEKVVSCLLELMYYNLWFVRGIKSNPQRVANKDLNRPHTTIRSLLQETIGVSFKHQQFKTKCSLFSDFFN